MGRSAPRRVRPGRALLSMSLAALLSALVYSQAVSVALGRSETGGVKPLVIGIGLATGLGSALFARNWFFHLLAAVLALAAAFFGELYGVADALNRSWAGAGLTTPEIFVRHTEAVGDTWQAWPGGADSAGALLLAPAATLLFGALVSRGKEGPVSSG